MTKRQVILLGKLLGRIADHEGIDESTRRICVCVVEDVISNESSGFVTSKGGYITGNISLKEWRALAKVDQRMKPAVKATDQDANK